MRHCPRPEQIADLLGGADRAALEEHVEHCPACQEALGRLTGGAETSRWQQLYAGLPRPGEAEVTGLGRLLVEWAPAATPDSPRDP
jgi:hypothetical protein